MNLLKKSKPRENEKLVSLSKEIKYGSKFVKFSMNIPRSLHSEFRRKSFLEELDMKDVLINAIVEYLKKK